MSPEKCLLKILQDAGKIDYKNLKKLSQGGRDAEVDKIIERWLRWVRLVNRLSLGVEEEE